MINPLEICYYMYKSDLYDYDVTLASQVVCIVTHTMFTAQTND